MALDPSSVAILTQRLPQDKIRTRKGKAGMTFNYITPDFVIETLNKAFGSAWNTTIVHSGVYEDTVVVGLELSVPDENGAWVRKQQFGSCEVTRGLGVGEAFKGAASDALKKCATLLGLGLELYQADEPQTTGPAPVPQFSPPSRAPSAPPAPPRAPGAPPAPPASPRTPGAVPAPPRSVGAPAAPSAPAAPVAPSRPQGIVAPPKRARNPFDNPGAAGGGPNTTQINSLMNIAAKKEMSPAQLISLAGVVDAGGNPVQRFEDLQYGQAIEVIQAAQR